MLLKPALTRSEGEIDTSSLQERDPHELSTVIKKILRETPVPLLTYEMYDWCVAIQGCLICTAQCTCSPKIDLGDDALLRKDYMKKILRLCPKKNIGSTLWSFIGNTVT